MDKVVDKSNNVAPKLSRISIIYMFLPEKKLKKQAQMASGSLVGY